MKEGRVRKGETTGLPLKYKGVILVVVTVILVIAATLLMATPEIRSTMTSTTKDYMFDMTEANGRILESEVNALGAEKALSQDTLTELFKDVKIKTAESSYAYIVAPDGTMLYHPTAEKIGKPVENEVITGVVGDLKAGKVPEPEVVSYVFKGAVKYAGYYVNPTADFILVISADEADVFSSVNHVSLVMGISGGIAGVICLILAFIGFQFIISPLAKISKMVSRMGELNFMRDPELDKLLKNGDEIGVMARAVRNVQDKLNSVVAELKRQSELLYSSSDSLNGNVAVTVETIGQIDHAVHDMAGSASSQAADTQKASDSVVVIGNMVEETNHEMAKLRGNVEVMQKSGEEAEKTLKELEQINIEAKDSIEEIYRQTNTTNESAMKIKDAIALITSIAEETNLLSLNASIEAARAGEQGKGFAVVASQIQKLAEQSNESAMKVQQITDMLMEDSEKAVETMGKVKEIMDSQMNKVDITGNMFAKVQEEIENSMNGINNIYEKTENMDKAKINVVDVVQSLTAIAEENAAGTEETSASVTEVSSVVESISGNTEQLHDVAQTIDEAMKKFTV
ncbi:MAG: methyl-accepting chemotaxis protein [Roseburia sp.]|nr:methyl-accepting chemotaxis protein [Roseburia sp.]